MIILIGAMGSQQDVSSTDATPSSTETSEALGTDQECNSTTAVDDTAESSDSIDGSSKYVIERTYRHFSSKRNKSEIDNEQKQQCKRKELDLQADQNSEPKEPIDNDNTTSEVTQGEDSASKGESSTSAKQSDSNKSSIKVVYVATTPSEYVCPFSKLIKSKGTDGFLQCPKVESTAEITDVYEQFDEPHVRAEATQKSWDMQTNILDDEELLYENKMCSVAHFNGVEWTTPIPVVLQLIAKKGRDSKRFVCYQVGTGRLQLNTTILATMSVNKLKRNSIIFAGQLIADEKKLAPHRIIFQDQRQRDACHEHF
ncbi:uncharacterized protein BXIN_2908 [Babesia sp. Xinjiang]|uniref:uncharacterized protein n=1 Tax=Babesia sp. Xinjiang TaxID=462227 RepID=UPI000A255930|nr:uncharacterized protein BXIN_2908 [Babesia sp. Xinjiang]ORM39509.1 hypothetical protein BXIN_2908 [Babesia sp. Xinjiang]